MLLEIIFMNSSENSAPSTQNSIACMNINIKSLGSQKFKLVTEVAKKQDLAIQGRYFLF